MIPEAAVEAAAEAIADLRRNGQEDAMETYARAALEAAAPHMLREAWEAGRVAGNHSLVQPNPYEVSK